MLISSTLQILADQDVLGGVTVPYILGAIGNPLVLSIVGSRLLLHLKEEGERGSLGGTSYRMSMLSTLVCS